VFIDSKNSALFLVLRELVEQEVDGVHGAHRIENTTQHVHLLEHGRIGEQLFLARAGARDVDGREGALVGTLRSRMSSELPVPLNSSKITSSMRLPVSISAVAMMVSEPPSSMLRAAPKKRFGRCSALASTPPVSTCRRTAPRCCRHGPSG